MVIARGLTRADVSTAGMETFAAAKTSRGSPGFDYFNKSRWRDRRWSRC